MIKTENIDIIIPVLNGGTTLPACLDSVLKQTYKNFNVIVVDNNSTDTTPSIINAYTKKDSRVTSVFESFQSRGAARNKGIEKATARIIAMTDSDCVVPENWLTELTGPIFRDDEDVVMGSEYALGDSKLTGLIQKLNISHLSDYINGDYISYLDTKNFAIKTSIAKNQKFDKLQKNSEDFEFSLRIGDIHRIRFIPELKVGHQHITSIKDWCSKTFDRAYWTSRVYLKHKDNYEIIKLPVFNVCLENDLASFPITVFKKIFRGPTFTTLFDLVSELSWRLGIDRGLKFHTKHLQK